jgi:hypothetical protein
MAPVAERMPSLCIYVHVDMCVFTDVCVCVGGWVGVCLFGGGRVGEGGMSCVYIICVYVCVYVGGCLFLY